MNKDLKLISANFFPVFFKTSLSGSPSPRGERQGRINLLSTVCLVSSGNKQLSRWMGKKGKPVPPQTATADAHAEKTWREREK